MTPLRMIFYATRDADGRIHIDNVVGSCFGQHHVHTPDDFARWVTSSPRVRPDDIVWIDSDTSCGCGPDVGPSER